ncbi:MAG TPA: hemerythrin domain-containing protein [Acidimicrobiales bacterium]|nr:hemerythrin domain-containing protein [Acidimicrobiales bacterium]
MDCLDLLIADHNRFRGTFARFKTAHESDDVMEMASLVKLMSQDLEIHTTIEEEIFYPAVHDLSEDIGETVDEGLEEHHVADVLDEEIKGLTPGDDAWVAKVKVLIEGVEHHAEEEETELFPSVRSATESDRREQLGQQMDARRAQMGFPTVAEREKLPVEELKTLATEQEIEGRSSMSKQDLAAAVDTR